MKVVWTDDDMAEAEDAYNEQVADAVRDDLTTLDQQLDDVDRKAGARRRMDTVWKNFIGERYIHPEGRAFRTVYIITGYGVVFYTVIKKQKHTQDALFRSLKNSREEVIRDAELKIVPRQQID